MHLTQRGVCAICERPPRGYKNLAVDHDHATGAVRGLLCQTCNAALGSFGDAPRLLQRAIDYLTEHRVPASRTHLVFLDVETTGLDPVRERLLEVAAIAVRAEDVEASPVWEFSTVVSGASPDVLAAMDPVVRRMHEANGLLAAVEAGEGLSCLEVESILAERIASLGERKGILLAGNSLGALDLPFLRRFMPRVMDAVHYHTVDVSGLARECDFAAGAGGFPFCAPLPESPGNHRALDDARWSLEAYRIIRRTLSDSYVAMLDETARARTERFKRDALAKETA